MRDEPLGPFHFFSRRFDPFVVLYSFALSLSTSFRFTGK